MRIAEHPILGEYEKGRLVHFTLDGKDATGYEGESVAAALHAMGIMTHRFTARQHKPRGIFCAIGRCTDCVMIVDGQPNVRTCITQLREGMNVQTQYGVQTKDQWMATSGVGSGMAPEMDPGRASEVGPGSASMIAGEVETR